MRFKIAAMLFYLAGLILPAAIFNRIEVKVAADQVAPQTQRIRIPLDTRGRRGLVLFDHRRHEAEINPDPNFPHKPIGGIACTGCHHSVKELTDVKQFQKCSDCHREEGHPDNPEDKAGYEMNSREALHRLCISCHVAKKFTVSNERVANSGFTKCSECHDRDSVRPVIAGQPREEQPAPWEPDPPTPDPTTRPRRVFQTPTDPPLGYAGRSGIDQVEQTTPDYVPRPDRWRIGFPLDPRFEKGSILNPYRQNVLKGDYPIFGQHHFLIVTAESDSFLNVRRIPVPSDVSTQRPDSEEFFGRGTQLFFRQNFVLSVDLFHGDAAFKPIDWRIHITPNFNINYLRTQENGIVNIDPRRGKTRTDGHVTLQEAFGEVRLGDTTRLFPFLRGKESQDGKSPFFDTTTFRAGIQPFISDFRGLIFSDTNLGARLFGNYASNRYQYNVAYFNMLEKDTNSELNAFEWRDQTVFIANLFRQDTRWKGYTTQFSFHYNNDRPSRHFDVNQFLVRPAQVGDVAEHGIKAAYFGWAGDGHMGRLNISHALYQAVGHDTRNPIAGKRTDINAQMGALELSIDRDWIRYKGSFFFASGDGDPFDDTARGFDAIFDFPEFAGGKFSFWNSQGIRLTQTGVALVNPDSLLPTLRSSKTEGQANFVNPGIFIYNLGLEAEVTPKLRGILNLNYLRFHRNETLEELLFQPGIRKDIGFDYGGGVIYRPLLNENIIVAAGFSSLIPGTGFKDIFSSNCVGVGCGAKPRILYSGFLRLKVTY